MWPGLLSFALPVIYYGAIVSSVFYLLPLDQEWPPLQVENFKHEGFDIIANDIQVFWLAQRRRSPASCP
jgi:hypothetical protein